MATSITSGVLGIPGRTLPASPKHIRNNASDKPMICSAVTSKLVQHVNHLTEPAVTAPVETEGDSRKVHNVGVFPLFRRRFDDRDFFSRHDVSEVLVQSVHGGVRGRVV